MNSKILTLLAVSFLTLFAACGKSASDRQAEVVFSDSANKSKGELYIRDDNSSEATLISSKKESESVEKRLLADRSELATSFDRYGNKTEIRNFENDPRLRFLIVRTSVTGEKEVTIYGHGSDARTLNELADMALTASSEEIANAAQMYATKTRREVRNYLKPSVASTPALAPLPSSQFPVVVPQQVEQFEPQPSSETVPVSQPSPEAQPQADKNKIQENLRQMLQNQSYN